MVMGTVFPAHFSLTAASRLLKKGRQVRRDLVSIACLRIGSTLTELSHSGVMPRGDFSVHFASRGRSSYIRAEEAAGIALLAVVLTALFFLGCWYYRRRNGYRMIQNAGGRSQSWRDIMRSGQYTEPGAAGENKAAINELRSLQPVLPNAPPAYDKLSGSLPPPYSP